MVTNKDPNSVLNLGKIEGKMVTAKEIHDDITKLSNFSNKMLAEQIMDNWRRIMKDPAIKCWQDIFKKAGFSLEEGDHCIINTYAGLLLPVPDKYKNQIHYTQSGDKKAVIFVKGQLADSFNVSKMKPHTQYKHSMPFLHRNLCDDNLKKAGVLDSHSRKD